MHMHGSDNDKSTVGLYNVHRDTAQALATDTNDTSIYSICISNGGRHQIVKVFKLLH